VLQPRFLRTGALKTCLRMSSACPDITIMVPLITKLHVGGGVRLVFNYQEALRLDLVTCCLFIFSSNAIVVALGGNEILDVQHPILI